ncbi:beta-ketoacyl-[acyl-carrier-protein] synthase family protein [Synoicihabitans lomoniglobus]|uniref:3-oxoacyl-[acyl-carrier-protein] synthase 1 n=1 Tax=Synoicihabitans lomoniglobus TaxID=2909285 RepID=A0AAE9ZZR1_9BACT|nr:beta-ketoacyl-[acyl-carrier-protein] synthase family protein [Opitutaceae bacterium LMO-M01]WED64453.1 beta-ketoacyl-[acyl-carrier-protein] synthase family protein [Opitutaceae bacterium LMO-M01]
MTHRAVITGLGFITSIGNDRPTVTTNLRALRPGLARIEFMGNPDLPVKVAGTIKDFDVASPSWRDWRHPSGYNLPREILRSLPPHGLYALCATDQALVDAGLSPTDLTDGTTGLYGASAGSAFLLHHHLAQLHAVRGERGNPMGVVSSIAGTLNFNLAAHYHIRGAVGGFAAACASSSHALGCALDDIRLGRQTRMLVVGAEEANAESILPFAAMRALTSRDDPLTASRPFDRTRNGFVGAGGAVCLILEELGSARRRGAPIYAELVGWGQAADGHNVAVSHPEGTGLADAMQRALADAALGPADVDYVNAHATSTVAGDRSEALALGNVFTAAGAHPRISSTKGLTGHPLSLAGVMEAGFCALALREGFIPGNANLTDPDEACAGLDLPRTTLDDSPDVVLNNSSGFGGSNVCHVLRRLT